MAKTKPRTHKHKGTASSMKRIPRPAITKANYEALADFRFAIRKFLAFSAHAAKSAGLTAQQHQALLTIKGVPEDESIGIQQLAERLLVRHNTTVELVDRLVEAGLVERSRDHDDKRRSVLELTPRAERVLESLSSAHLQELQSVRPVMLNLLRQLA
jgi:DNA-binding MarR family transcriptional regulator